MKKRQKRQILTLALVAICSLPFQNLIAQNGIGYPPTDVVTSAEVMPVLQSCSSIDQRAEREACSNESMMEHIMENLVYPEDARQKGIEGTVQVQFVVSQKGSIKSVEILRGPDLLQKAAFTVVNSLPSFVPGTNQGKAVSVQYVLPIRFELGE
tara:strand:- start:2072 stop:2533 length:462 start_codon:yes stop_codon:yes gene_type:complete